MANTKPNLTYQPVPYTTTTQDYLKQQTTTYQTKPDLPNPTRPTKPNLTYQTQPDLPNQTRPHLPNQTYWTKPTQPNLPSQTYIQTKTKTKTISINWQENHFFCVQCQYEASSEAILKYHQDRIQYIKKQNIIVIYVEFRYHKRSVHEGVKYPCWQCDNQATTKGSLAQHKQVVHEGIKKCGHQSISKGDLAQHKRAVKYPC